VGVYGGPDLSESGLVLAFDAGNSKSYFGYWSPNLSNGANAFDGSLSTLAGILGGSFGPYTYTFTKPPAIISARMYVTLGASSGQVGSTTNVFLVNGIDVTQKAKNANLYYPTSGWIDVTVEAGSNWNTFQFTGTSGSTNPGIAAIEVNGNILIGNYGGTTWTDLSGRGNTGTLTNGPTYSSSNGGSIVFDGVDDYISVSSLSNYNFGNSMSVFIFHRNVGGDYRGLINNGYFNGCGFELRYGRENYFGGSDNGTSLYVKLNTGSGTALLTINAELNVWGYYGFTYNGSQLISYKNGTQFSSTSLSGNINVVQNPVIIGWDSFYSQYLSGLVSQATIYNRALAASEIQQNFNANRSRFGI
jgi:hypothetical protein